MHADAASEASAAQELGLSEPTPALVRNAMRELEYGERLTLHRMTVGMGGTTSEVYSLAELVSQIFGTRWDRLQVEASKASLVWVDPARLTAWLRDVIGDTALADAVESALQGADSYYKAQIEAIYPAFRVRVAQYEVILAEDGMQD